MNQLFEKMADHDKKLQEEAQAQYEAEEAEREAEEAQREAEVEAQAEAQLKYEEEHPQPPPAAWNPFGFFRQPPPQNDRDMYPPTLMAARNN